MGFAFLTAVEVLDGFSSEWVLLPDIIANASDCFICLPGITMEGAADHTKFSFHTTQYAQYRPNVLGSSLGTNSKGLQWTNLLAFG
jgi:hypothetical protein